MGGVAGPARIPMNLSSFQGFEPWKGPQESNQIKAPKITLGKIPRHLDSAAWFLYHLCVWFVSEDVFFGGTNPQRNSSQPAKSVTRSKGLDLCGDKQTK